MTEKVSKDLFKEFLTLIRLKGTVETNEILFESTPKSIMAHARSLDKGFGLKAVYNGTFEEKDEVGILRFEAFINYVEQMDDDFEITYKANKINLTTKKTKIATPMQAKQLIENKLEPEKFKKLLEKIEGGVSFTLSEENMKDIAKKYSAVPSEEIILKGEKGKLIVNLKSSEDETRFYKEYEIPELKEKFAISISRKIVDLLACLKFPVLVKVISTDEIKALKVEIKKEKFTLEYLFSLNNYEENPAPEVVVSKEKTDA